MNRFAVLALTLAPAAHVFGAEVPDFSAKIAPLFQEHCMDCHSNDDPDGKFTLETFDGLMKGGKTGKVIEPKNAEGSLLVKFLEGRSGKEGKNKFMPPGKNEHLSAESIALIRLWIDAGAPAPVDDGKPVDVLARLPKIAPKGERVKAIQALAFSPQAKLIATGSYAVVQLVDATTRLPVRTLGGAAGKVNALAFSADGTMIFAAAGDPGLGGVAYQWKVADGTLVRKYEGHRDAVYALALSPDGRTLATGSYDQKIKLWSTADGTEIKTLAGHTGGVFGLSFRHDGKVLASASADRTVKLWDVTSGKRLDTFSQPLKEQTAVAFSPDGTSLAAGGVDNRVRVWTVSADAQEGSNPLRLTRFAHESAVLNVAYSADGLTLISTAADRAVKLWKAADVSEQTVLETQPDWAPGLAVLSGNQIALGRLDGSLAVYDAATGALVPAAKPMAAKAVAKPAMAMLPEVASVEPRGLQSGVTTKLKIAGKNLAGISAVKVSGPSLSAMISANDEKGTSAEITVIADANAPRGTVELSVVTSAGESVKKKISVDSLPQVIAPGTPETVMLNELPVNIWGTLAATGQQDNFRFHARAGQTLVFDLAAKRIESKAVTTRLEIHDAEKRLLFANNGLDSGSDPFIAFTAPRDGDYTVRVLEITLEGSPEHTYRLTAGELPYVTGWWPLSVPANRESVVQLIGPNLTTKSVTVKAGADGELTLPAESDAYRSRVNMRVAVSALPELMEQEPNDELANAQPLPIPSSVNGRLTAADHADFDLYKIEAAKDAPLVIETRAAMLGSPADTKIEVLDANGLPVPRVLLQATKDSWLALRSTDAVSPGIRLGQFAEMELNDLMYFNGEVTKILRLARGPDADMVYFMRNGVRRNFFDTSAAGHGLDEPCYVVEPRPVGTKIVPTGLPVFTVNYANDDDADRQLGRDSRLLFTAPSSGSYFIRVSDTRGWSGERMAYRLIVRQPKPDFTATLAAPGAANLAAGSGEQFVVRVERADGWDAAVRVDVHGVPAGFFVSSPLLVEAGHLTATGCIFARPDTKPGTVDFSGVKLTATAEVGGQLVEKPMAGFSKVAVAPTPKQALFFEPDVSGKPEGDGKVAPAQPYEITLAPGGRVPAWLRVARNGNDALLSLDVEDLPFGVIVDSIGLSGVQIREGENEREIFLSCAPFVPEQDRLCHVLIGSARVNESVERAQASFPVLLKIRKPTTLQTVSAK